MRRRIIITSLVALAVVAGLLGLQALLPAPQAPTSDPSTAGSMAASQGAKSAGPGDNGPATEAGPGSAAQSVDPARAELIQLARNVITRDAATRRAALQEIRERGEPDMAPALIMALRFTGDRDGELTYTLQYLTDEEIKADWHAWMIWQETHPEIEAFDGFDQLKADVLASIDVDYLEFIYPGVEHEIRLEEVVWGGVRARDGIPSLDFPKRIAADEASYLNPDDLVFGISINGDTRAYPLRIMNWHEMFNDRIGGVDLALAYCTLCGSGILYETKVEGRDEPFLFGSSGLLYRSNKLMFDHATNSLWNQFTGRPVVGPLVGSGIELTTRPVVITTWEAWRADHPETTVLSLETGHLRDYSPGAVYGDYFASPDLMFPAAVDDDNTLAPKDFVFGITVPGKLKAWPLSVFEGGRVLMDEIEGEPIVLIGDQATRTVRAYESGGRAFTASESSLDVVMADGMPWQVTEEALVGLGGEVLPRLAGHVAYWFAWDGFRGETEFYEEP